GIFYGAAHMPDFEKRLAEDFDLKKDKVEWVTAWDLKAKRAGVPPLLKLLEQLDKGSRAACGVARLLRRKRLTPAPPSPTPRTPRSGGSRAPGSGTSAACGRCRGSAAASRAGRGRGRGP